MIRRLIVLVVSTFVALGCSQSASDVATQIRTGEFPRYAGGIVGSVPVGVIPDAILRDNDRNKDIKLNIEYPQRTTEARPLIVFSPAFGLSNRDYVRLSSFWASHGYVVIRASHTDVGSELSQTQADWRNRVRDVTHILDSLPRLAELYPELAGKIDATKVAVAGHGYGAVVAMLAGGAQSFPGGVSYADPRVKAVVAMSPPGPSEARGLTRESWANVTTPTLFITGTADHGIADSETPESRREAFAASPAGDKWLVVLEGGRYATFTGRSDSLMEDVARERARTAAAYPDDPTVARGPEPRGPERRVTNAEMRVLRQQDILNLARGLSLGFFNAYLRGDAEGRKALEESATRNGVVLERK